MFNRSPPLFLFYGGNLPKGAEGSPLSKKITRARRPYLTQGQRYDFSMSFEF